MQSPPTVSRSRSTENPPSEWEKGEVKGKDKISPTILLSQSAPAPIEIKKSVFKSPSKGKESQLMTSGKLRKREQKLLTNNRFGELMGAWGIPEEEELIKAFDVAYRKPLNAHGSLYIFSKYLCFATRNKNIKWAVQLSDIQKIEVKKGHHSPKTFVFLHLGDGSSYVMHKFRGRTGRSRNEMVATVLLAWEHARGNKSIDLALLRAAGSYALKHPLLKQLLEQHETTAEEEEEDEEERSDNDSNNAVTSAPSEVDEFWDQFDPPVLPPNQNNELPDSLVACRPANLAQADRETTFPVSVTKMWLLLFSDSSTLVADYQQKNGAFELHSTKWEDKGTYFERTYGFSKPIQSRLMSGTCVVVQEQKACLLNSGTLLHFGASAMTGVPKGDCFKLKSMYEISDVGDGITKIRYWAWVDWHKGGGILKGPIGSGTARAALDSFGTQMEYIRNKLPTAKAYVAGSTQTTPSSSLSSSAANIPISPTSANPPVHTSLTVSKPNTGGFGSLSMVETLLLALVIFFLLTTLYYRWSASSLSAMVEELKAAQEGVKVLSP